MVTIFATKYCRRSFGNLLKDWSLEELYDKRFKADENGAFN